MVNEFSRGENDNSEKQDVDSAEATTSQLLMDAVIRSVMATGIKPPAPEVTNVGQVRKMEMPLGWEQGPDYSKRQHAANYQEFHPNGQNDCQLGFYYRGRRTSESAGENFHNILSQEDHELSKNEYNSLEEVVRDKAKAVDFTLKSARTEEINGKRVLVVEGRYNKNQNDSKHMFIDSDGTGTAVQEIFFQAPKDKFAVYGNAATQAMKTVRWK